AVYQGSVYAIPMDTDDRLLYWNRKLFREVGLDPDRPPRTWEELVEYNARLTKRRPDGTFERIGFIPVTKQYMNSWFYLYSWQNGGEFMSPDGRTCTMRNPESVGALQWLRDYYDGISGAENVQAFASTFQPREQDPFIVGKMAMKIDLNTAVRILGRFAKDLDYGVAPPPVPAARLRGEGRFRGEPPYITWSGGFSWAIPVGSKHPEEAWLFIKWMNSLESRRIFNRVQKEWNESQNPPRPYAPDMHANQRINEILFREFAPQGDSLVARRMREGTQVGLDMMRSAKFRPVTFVGQRLWDEHIRAFERATLKQTTPEQALGDAQATVQAELDAVYNRERHPLLNVPLAVGLSIGVVLLLIGAFVAYCRRQGRVAPLLRSEARAGYLFALPWILGFLGLFLGPMVAIVVFSLCDYDVLHPARWAGAQNYVDLMRDPMLAKAFYNILFLAGIAIPLSLALSLLLAMLLNTQVKGVPLYRTAFYLPSLTPIVAVAIVWLFILNPDSGVINQVWRSTLTAWLGIPAPGWLASEAWSKPALIL
ncbi:MAG TPA: extracellular solute-binding protein, partial [Armatimonadota bacterium]|nr:extracellular solute-binding protein [Armatimonadota bacterium]